MRTGYKASAVTLTFHNYNNSMPLPNITRALFWVCVLSLLSSATTMYITPILATIEIKLIYLEVSRCNYELVLAILCCIDTCQVKYFSL